MIDHTQPRPGGGDQGPDLSWRPLYRAGAIAAGISVTLYLVALGLFFVTPLPPTSGGVEMLEFVEANRAVYLLKQVLWLVPSPLMIILFLALAMALKHLGKSFALIAGVIGILSWAGTFAWPATGDGSLVLIMLSDSYATAVTEGERIALAGAAETLIAFNDVPAPLGVMQAVGVLLIAVLMVRGVFHPGVAWLGVATGLAGIFCEALRPWLGGLYAAYGVLLFVWMVWIGLELWRLGAKTPAEQPEQGNAPLSPQRLGIA